MNKKLFTSAFLSLFLLFLTSCIQMRDYTGIKEGAFGLDIQKGFGSGTEKKDYYVVKDGEGIIVGDKKREVVNKIGLPDKIESTIEGYENWTYEERKMKFLFKEGRLNGGSQIDK